MLLIKKQFELFIFFLGLLLSVQLTTENFINICFALDVNLSWNASPESDLAGYGVYQSEGTGGPPYLLIEDLPLDDLADPNNPQVVITGLEDGKKYYFALTAYDKSGNESKYSKEICIKFDSLSATNCESASESAGGGGGGGGGGCFISALTGGFRW